MTQNDTTFTAEVRHEVVADFIRRIFDGSLKLDDIPSNLPPDNPLYQRGINSRVKLLLNIEKYVSGKVRNEELAELESDIFRQIGILRMCDSLKENISITTMEKEVAKLHSRMDNLNTLLVEVLKVLKRIGDKIDKV
ncbi:MAG TPA: hypothetical protein VF242_06025 [Nitrososphaeraceae archaeon]